MSLFVGYIEFPWFYDRPMKTTYFILMSEEKKKKEVVPEPEFYIPPEELQKAFEETKALFDLSNKKKSKKRAVAGEKSMGGLGNGGNLAHMKAETAGDQYHKYIDVGSVSYEFFIDSGSCV